jgi:hypothetical protein
VPSKADDAAVLLALQQALQQLQAVRAGAQQDQQQQQQQRQQGPCTASTVMAELQGMQHEVLQLLEAPQG